MCFGGNFAHKSTTFLATTLLQAVFQSYPISTLFVKNYGCTKEKQRPPQVLPFTELMEMLAIINNFEDTDYKGSAHSLRKVESTVKLVVSSFSFQNSSFSMSFISYETYIRDAQYEKESASNHTV